MTFLDHIKDITTITMTLFAVIDIIGSIPIIITLRQKQELFSLPKLLLQLV